MKKIKKLIIRKIKLFKKIKFKTNKIKNFKHKKLINKHKFKKIKNNYKLKILIKNRIQKI